MMTNLSYPPRAGWALAAVLLLGLVCAGRASAQDRVLCVDRPDATRPRNAYYDGNREPLLPSPLTKLPFGAIKPEGWIRKELELEADGYVGHLTEISNYCRHENNAWLSPDGVGVNGWEEVPYWLRGFSALGYVLNDRRIIQETQLWIDAALASQMEDGYFGPRANLAEPFFAVPASWLTTPDGKPGLAAEYFSDAQFTLPKFRRNDPQVDFNWERKEGDAKPADAAAPFEGLKEPFSARWTGTLTPTADGEWIFAAVLDGKARLTLDGRTVFDTIARGRGEPVARKQVRLTRGKAVRVTLECVQTGGRHVLRWVARNAAYSGASTPDLMPNMSMMYALRAYYEYTGDKRVLDLLTRYFKWQLKIPDAHFFTGGWQVPRIGDNLDSVVWLYNRTGDGFLLDLADKCRRCGASWMKAPTAAHNVDFSQGFRKPAQCYPLNKDPHYLQQSEDNWASIIDIYGQVPGGMFGGDEFARPGYIDPRQAIETCGIVDAMLSHEILLQISGDARWADRCENAAFNSLPAATTADLKALRYLTSPNQISSDSRNKAPELADGGDMQGMNPYIHRCCQHNSGMGWPYFTQNLWQATPGNGLAAVLYSECQVSAKAGSGQSVTIAEEAHYPFDGTVRFKFTCPAPATFPLYLRVPGWCPDACVTLNGRPLAVKSKPASYLLIDRTWTTGDELTLELPMKVSVTRWARNKDSASVNLGPLTFSLKIGETYTRYAGTKEWPAWEVAASTPWNYGLVLDGADPARSFEVVRKPWPASEEVFAQESTPIEIKAQGRRIGNWKQDGLGLVELLQPSPVKSDAPVEPITLAPMGACRLRISAFPVIGAGSDAHAWKPVVPAYASFWNKDKDFEALHDGQVPDGTKRETPLFGWVGWAGAGTGQRHWLRQDLEHEAVIDSCEIYWVIGKSWFTTPEWWTLSYKDGDDWKPVEYVNGQPEIRPSGFTRLAFKPVRTTALKIEAQTRKGKSCGFYEWRLWTPDGQTHSHALYRSFGVDLAGNPVVKRLSRCEFTWFKDPTDPASRLPRDLKLYYRVGDQWNAIPVAKAPTFVEGAKTVLTFPPVEAAEIKAEIIADRDASAGPSDWIVK